MKCRSVSFNATSVHSGLQHFRFWFFRAADTRKRWSMDFKRQSWQGKSKFQTGVPRQLLMDPNKKIRGKMYSRKKKVRKELVGRTSRLRRCYQRRRRHLYSPQTPRGVYTVCTGKLLEGRRCEESCAWPPGSGRKAQRRVVRVFVGSWLTSIGGQGPTRS